MEFDEKLIEEIEKYVNSLDSYELTYFDVMKNSSKELVWSNLLAFFLDYNKPHGLGKLFIKSLLEVCGINNSKNMELNDFYIYREFHTLKSNSIDLIVDSNNFCIGVENKVKAELYNDLEDYSNTINSNFGKQGKTVVKIVLSINECEIDNKLDFENILYSDLVKIIEKNEDEFEIDTTNKFYQLYKDFLENIKKQTGVLDMKDVEKFIDFYRKKEKELDVFFDKYEQVKKFMENKQKDLINLIQTKFEKNLNIPETVNIEYKNQFTYNGYKFIKFIITDSENNTKLTWESYIDKIMMPNGFYGNIQIKNFDLVLDNSTDLNTFVDELLKKIQSEFDFSLKKPEVLV